VALVEICSERLDLGAGFCKRARAIDVVGGALAFFFNGKLGGDAAAGVGFAHTARAKASELLLWRAPGDDEAVEPWGHSGLDQQSGFDENRSVRAAFLPVFELSENDLVNARMKNGVEPRELRGIRKDNGSQFVTVDVFGSVGEIGAERLKNFVVGDLAGFHELMGDGIGVENGEAKFAKNCSDGTFAAGDAAGEAEFQH